MKVTIPRVIATALFVAVTGMTSFAEDYQCRRAGGCLASITEGGVVKRVVFRRGDLISTAEGWNVNPRNGWVKIGPEGVR